MLFLLPDVYICNTIHSICGDVLQNTFVEAPDYLLASSIQILLLQVYLGDLSDSVVCL